MSENMDRRSFTVAMAYAMLGGAAITLTGCGDSGGSSTGPYAPTPTSPPVGDKAATISANHGHAAVITGAQLEAGGGLTLDIKGNAPHNHQVSLTGDEVVNIRNNQTVTKASTVTDGGSSYGGEHSHGVTFN
jgi:hypothetical protein